MWSSTSLRRLMSCAFLIAVPVSIQPLYATHTTIEDGEVEFELASGSGQARAWADTPSFPDPEDRKPFEFTPGATSGDKSVSAFLDFSDPGTRVDRSHATASGRFNVGHSVTATVSASAGFEQFGLDCCFTRAVGTAGFSFLVDIPAGKTIDIVSTFPEFILGRGSANVRVFNNHAAGSEVARIFVGGDTPDIRDFALRDLGPGSYQFNVTVDAGLDFKKVNLHAYPTSFLTSVEPRAPDPVPVFGGPGEVGGFEFHADVTDEAELSADLTLALTSDVSADLDPAQAEALDFFIPTDVLYHWDINLTPDSLPGPATLVFGYQEGDLLERTTEESLAIHHFNGESWELIPSAVDPEANTITVVTDSLSPFALGTVPEPSVAASLIVTTMLIICLRRKPASTVGGWAGHSP